MLWRSPFGRSLALIMVGFTLVPMVILTALGIFNIQFQLRERILTQTATVAALIQSSLTRWVGEGRTQLAATATQADVAQNLSLIFSSKEDLPAIRQSLNRTLFILTTRYFSDVYLVNAAGKIILSSQITAQNKALGLDLVGLTQSGKYTWGFGSLPVFGSQVGLMWQPIRDQDRNLVGFLVGQISLESISSVVRNNTVGMGQSGETYLIDPDNMPLTQLRFPLPSSSQARLQFKPLSTQYSVNGMFSGQFDDYGSRPVIGLN
jgi:hypothetical protein